MIFIITGFFVTGLFASAYASSHVFDTVACYQLGENDVEANKLRNPDQPRIKQQAFFAFEDIGQQGDWKTFEAKFLEQCVAAYNKAYDRMLRNEAMEGSEIRSMPYDEAMETVMTIAEDAEQIGINNAECIEDGKRDALQFKSKTRVSPADVEIRAAASFVQTYNINPLEDRGNYEVFLDGFDSGCQKAYQTGYEQNAKGEGQIDATDVGKKDGYNDPQCASEGRNDYRNDASREPPNVFEIGLRQAEKNPFNIVLEVQQYEEYRVAYENGCNEAYYDAYDKARSAASSSGDGGCLIATAAYGTELSSEVQNLREIRNKMYETELGGDVMHAVNDFYYSFSPTVADWERQNPAFKDTVKLLITPSMTSFAIMDHNSLDSETGLIGYVVGIVSINMGMHFVAPAIVVWQIKKRI